MVRLRCCAAELPGTGDSAWPYSMHGKAKHGLGPPVTLEEFQAAIRARHRAAKSETEHDSGSVAAVDFQ